MKFTQLPDEPDSSLLLRLAANLILTHCPDVEVHHPDYDELLTGTEFAETIHDHVEQVAADIAKRGTDMIFDGRIIQAGGDDKVPTVTITSSARQLAACKTIPFYKPATIRITPLS